MLRLIENRTLTRAAFVSMDADGREVDSVLKREFLENPDKALALVECITRTLPSHVREGEVGVSGGELPDGAVVEGRSVSEGSSDVDSRASGNAATDVVSSDTKKMSDEELVDELIEQGYSVREAYAILARAGVGEHGDMMVRTDRKDPKRREVSNGAR